MLPVVMLLSVALSMLLQSAAAAPSELKADGGYFLLLGGQAGSHEAWSPNGGDFPVFEDVPGDNIGSSAALLGDAVISSGGGYNAESWKHCYATSVSDPASWTEIAEMQDPRYIYTLTTVGDQVVATGGFGVDGVLSSVEMYREGALAWTTADWSLKSGVADHCTVAISATEIILMGGRVDSSAVDAVTKYEVGTGSMTELPPLPEPMYGFACAIKDNKVYITGGVTNTSRLAHTHMLDLTNVEEGWMEGPKLNQARNTHFMGELGGSLYVLGGYDDAGEVSVERLDGDAWVEVEEGLREMFAFGGGVVVQDN